MGLMVQMSLISSSKAALHFAFWGLSYSHRQRGLKLHIPVILKNKSACNPAP